MFIVLNYFSDVHCSYLNYLVSKVLSICLLVFPCNNFLFFKIWIPITTKITLLSNMLPCRPLSILIPPYAIHSSGTSANFHQITCCHSQSPSGEPHLLFLRVHSQKPVTYREMFFRLFCACLWLLHILRKKEELNVCDLQEAGVMFNLWSFQNWKQGVYLYVRGISRSGGGKSRVEKKKRPLRVGDCFRMNIEAKKLNNTTPCRGDVILLPHFHVTVPFYAVTLPPFCFLKDLNNALWRVQIEKSFTV